jgi:hypothetical protein
MILDGSKTHTIRAERAHPDRSGNWLYLYTGLRQKGAQLLMRALCTRVEEISIDASGIIFVDSIRLCPDEAEQLARRDGFSCYAEMMGFWEGRLPFKGQIIHWGRRWMTSEAQ